jgi:acetyl-CoA acetyltransferase
MNVYIAGVGMTPFGKLRDKSVKDLLREAVVEAVKDAGCELRDIQAAFVAQTTQGYFEGQTFIRGPIALRAMGIHGIPMLTVENACASGSTALWQAANFILSGAGDVALAVGVEKMNVGDKEKALALFDSGWDIYAADQTLARLKKGGEGIAVPEGSTSSDPYSVFMEVYAAFARRHMQVYGLTQRQIAAVSAKNHQHSVHNERAHFRRPFTVEEVLAAKPIVYPLTAPMCAPLTDGAAAAIVCNDRALARLGVERKRAIRVMHIALASGRDDLPEGGTENSFTSVARAAYEAAGIGPEDISVAEVHDATAFGEIKQTENLGLCPVGEGGICAERGETRIGGRIPVNPSGGLESKGHPLGATGLAQVFELVSQLRGECGARQVEGARFAIQENGGGLIGTEEAVFVISIFGRNH